MLGTYRRRLLQSIQVVYIYFQNLDNYPLDHRQIQLDSEAIQRLMLGGDYVETSAASSTATSHGESSTTRAKSPLSQAMLQIHSPNSVPDLSVGEGVVLQMEDGKATLQMEEGKATLITHPNGVTIKSEKDCKDSSNAGKSCSEADDVFEKRQEKFKTEPHTRQTLQAVLSNLITSHTGNVNRAAESQTKHKIEGLIPATVKNTPPAKKGSPDASATKSHPTILVSPTVSASVPSKGVNSPGSRKGSVGEVSVSGSSNGSSPLVSPGATPASDRKRTKAKVPHPAFNIQANSVEKMGGVMYNYNLPDRGLGTLLSPSPAVSVSPPAVSVPRFPVSVTQTMASQMLNFVTAGGWQVPRPLSHSPNSNDSRNSGSPLDLSSVRETSPIVVKSKADIKVPIPSPVRILPKQPMVRENEQKSPALSPTANGKKQAFKKQQSDVTSPAVVSELPYTQEMLYLFNKEVEIVSVGKNKWIVRNEKELCDLIKKNTEAHQGAICQNGLDKTDAKLAKHCSNGTDLIKRPSSECSSEEQRSKVVKLTNGDVHSGDEGQENLSHSPNTSVAVSISNHS